MTKKLFGREIEDIWIKGTETEDEVEEVYSKLNQQMDKLYAFILSYYEYLYNKRDYGNKNPMSMIEIHVLTEICDNPGITVTDIAKKWKRTTSSISQMIRSFEKDELVKKETNQEDAKINNLHILPKGRELTLMHKRYDNLDFIKTMKELAKDTSYEEIESFFKVADTYRKIMERYDKNKSSFK